MAFPEVSIELRGATLAAFEPSRPMLVVRADPVHSRTGIEAGESCAPRCDSQRDDRDPRCPPHDFAAIVAYSPACAIPAVPGVLP